MLGDGDIIWRTIGGRRIPIKVGQSLSDAMKQSGKFTFKKLKEKKYDDSNYKFLPEDDDEAYDKYYEMSDECYDKLTPEERRIIKDHYVGKEESYYINSVLREKSYEQLSDIRKEQVDALDKACETYTAKEDMASVRSVDFNYLRNAYKLNIKDYGDFDRSIIAKQMKDFIGSELSSKGYTSVSLNESGNGMFNNLAVKMKINIPKGQNMYVADNIGEYEAILPRNTRLVLKDVGFEESKVAGMEKEYGKILLTYEVVKNGKK